MLGNWVAIFLAAPGVTIQVHTHIVYSFRNIIFFSISKFCWSQRENVNKLNNTFEFVFVCKSCELKHQCVWQHNWHSQFKGITFSTIERVSFCFFGFQKHASPAVGFLLKAPIRWLVFSVMNLDCQMLCIIHLKFY